ncbi:glycoside hydrolase family 3 N-terminal domain-containing protein [Propionibacterium australiense]|uniref:beta-N-acetylhexosaminidase n=1 Tax=Propionibacterium australiense TaxID=119981 RepID=A0A383S669_9ACTN|nr:glycoside hydrolase family 3 N-terminal domain-containing protein [Propionibacterium australiense]RLP09023.1 glycoside hydrolase family 3 protein [Propionibacterium australiense]RLP09043.1 glycoside hydrolase family 3 protein [Propionibacterium australiense]SYZ33407.1 Glycoside hydrolase superfamily [Propionibacterium australiense]VEH91905.1 Beta-hexosaminidase [Propionibacterium australiense]
MSERPCAHGTGPLAVPRRRRPRGVTGVVGAVLLAMAVSGCAMGPWGAGGGSSQPSSAARSGGPASSRTSPSADGSGTAQLDSACRDAAAGMSLSAQVQTLYMGAVTQSTPSAAVNELGQQMVGSVILVASPTSMNAAKTLTDALHRQDPEALIAVDQEGGEVTHLSGEGFTPIPSAAEQATQPAEQITENWTTWAGELGQAGINYDLAPVADVVTAEMATRNQPIGLLGRGYGQTPGDVTANAGAALAGMRNANILTSIKHFPGLGDVTENTDFAVAIDTTTTADSDTVKVFADLAGSTDSVMVSSAIYQQIDPDNPAVFSSTIVTGLLREQLGYEGVIISDDLGSAVALEAYPVAERGTRFLRAGGDLALDVDPSTVNDMVRDTIKAAESDEEFAAQITDKAVRVLAMKQQAGVYSCGG